MKIVATANSLAFRSKQLQQSKNITAKIPKTSGASKTTYGIVGIISIIAGLAVGWYTEKQNPSAGRDFHQAKAQMIEDCVSLENTIPPAARICSNTPGKRGLACYSRLSQTEYETSKINTCLNSIRTTAEEAIKLLIK